MLIVAKHWVRTLTDVRAVVRSCLPLTRLKYAGVAEASLLEMQEI